MKQRKFAENPTYIILSQRLEKSHGNLLLGRVVVDMQNPTDEWAPSQSDGLLKTLQGQTMEVVDTNFQALFSIEKNKTAQMKIGQFLDLDMAKTIDREHSIESPFVRTRIITQHRIAYKALLEDHRAEIKELLKNNQNEGFMIVGFKSAVENKLGRAQKDTRTRDVNTNLPVGTLAEAATTSTTVLGKGADIDLNLRISNTAELSSQSVASGEQIFAIRYRRLKLNRGPYLHRKAEPSIDFGGIETFEPKHGVFGDGFEDEREIVSEDDDDSENSDTQSTLAGNEISIADQTNEDKIELEEEFVLEDTPDGDVLL
jgi:hypothetical protein